MHLLIAIFETRLNIEPHDQNYNIKITEYYNQSRIFILFKINKTPLKMIVSIYFNGNIFNSEPYVKLLHIGPVKLDFKI